MIHLHFNAMYNFVQLFVAFCKIYGLKLQTMHRPLHPKQRDTATLHLIGEIYQ